MRKLIEAFRPSFLSRENTPEIHENETSIIRDFVLFLRDLVVIFFVVMIVRTFLAQPFEISGRSMDPSFADGEFIILDRLSYLASPTEGEARANMSTDTSFAAYYQRIGDAFGRFVMGIIDIHNGDPQRWDVIVLRPHSIPSKEFFIKRVVGAPGDTLRFQDGLVSVRPEGAKDFTLLDESYLSEENKGRTFLDTYENTDITVPEGEYFVMGDNRRHSTDSRHCFLKCSIEGSSRFLRREDVVGRVAFSLGCPRALGIVTWGMLCEVPSPTRWSDIPNRHTYFGL